MDQNQPLVAAHHAALVELTLRLGRLEKHLGFELREYPLATFALEGSNIPAPYEPCSCDESMALRSRIIELELQLGEKS